MLYLCFLFFLAGFSLVIIGVVRLVLNAIQVGSWSLLQHPRLWSAPTRQHMATVGIGLLLVLLGVASGYGF